LNSVPPSPRAVPPLVEPGQAALVMLAYALCFVAVSAALVWWRDVT
jgi:hypothetical protein